MDSQSKTIKIEFSILMVLYEIEKNIYKTLAIGINTLLLAAHFPLNSLPASNLPPPKTRIVMKMIR
jgi:hypothetical protein